MAELGTGLVNAGQAIVLGGGRDPRPRNWGKMNHIQRLRFRPA